MLKNLSLTIAFAGAMLSATSAQALSVYFNGGAAATNLNGLTIFEDFESYADGASYNGASQIQSPPSNGTGAVPAFGSTGKYLSIQNGSTTSSVTIPFAPAQVLSFVIGSLDNFNGITLNLQNAGAVTFTGLAMITGLAADQGLPPPPTNGDQASPITNGRVFYDTLGLDTINSFVLFSNGTAFEVDNIAAAVPEPATWGMMILAAGMAGTALRRRRNRDAMA